MFLQMIKFTFSDGWSRSWRLHGCICRVGGPVAHLRSPLIILPPLQSAWTELVLGKLGTTSSSIKDPIAFMLLLEYGSTSVICSIHFRLNSSPVCLLQLLVLILPFLTTCDHCYAVAVARRADSHHIRLPHKGVSTSYCFWTLWYYFAVI